MKFSVFLFFHLVLCLRSLEPSLCSASRILKVNQKIVGGYVPKSSSSLARFIVSIRWMQERFFGHGHFCGGSILSEISILTAAHCTVNKYGRQVSPKSLKVVTGNIQRFVQIPASGIYDVVKIIAHENFIWRMLINDIAILRTKKISFIPNICEPVKLASEMPEPNSEVIVLGWGTIWEGGPASNELLYIKLILFSDARCDALLEFFNEGISLCAGVEGDDPADACYGDSGGPLFYNETLVGIVSYGLGCGHPLSPGIYTNISMFHPWILRNRSNRLLAVHTTTLLFTSNLYINFIKTYLESK